MEKITRLSDILSGMGGALSGIMIVGGTLLVIAEIIIRTFFSGTLYITEEYSGYLMAALTFMALGYTLREKGHIRMTFLHNVLHGRSRLILDMVCYLAGFVFCSVLTWVTFLFFRDSLMSGTRSMQISETYLAIPQSFLPAGAFMLALQFLAEFLKDLVRFRTGSWKDLAEESRDLGH
jgi:TRAP-type C4-dicarboxylate transport system permease small subunit